MRNVSRFTAALLALCLLLSCAALAEESAPITVTGIQKYGNLDLSLTGTEFLALGYAYGDVVTVGLNGQEYDMPVVSNYSDVDTGSMLVRVQITADADALIIAINMGDLATASGIATKEKIEEDPGFVWHYNEGVAEPVTVTFAMKEKGGYYDQFVMHQLARTDVREDYPQLSDAEYANFRMVATTGVGEGKLYRSSSPVNPEMSRNAYADAAAKEAGIRTVVNLADAEAVMKGYEGYTDTYYAGLNVIPLNLGVDFAAPDFEAGLADGIRFIAANEGPYLVHCNEGKDRAGFVSAVLESLMGASAGEIAADYMVTYYNYYGVEPGTEAYDTIASSNILKTLAKAFGLETLEGADLAAEAAKYLARIGVAEADIEAVRNNLK